MGPVGSDPGGSPRSATSDAGAGVGFGSQNTAEDAGELRDSATVAQNGCGYSRSKANDVARRMGLRVGLGDDRNHAGEQRRRRLVRVDVGDGGTAGYGAKEEARQALRAGAS